MYSTYTLSTDELTPQFLTVLREAYPHKRIEIAVQEAAAEKTPRRYEPEPFPTIEELKAEAAAKYAKMLETGIDPMAKFAGCLRNSTVFEEGGVEYQRRLRDEWPD